MSSCSSAAKYVALDVFDKTMRDKQGKIVDSAESRGIVYARATSPRAREIRDRDTFFGGVAFRASDTGVSIHPYAFRVVCSNGLVMGKSRMTAEFDFE